MVFIILQISEIARRGQLYFLQKYISVFAAFSAQTSISFLRLSTCYGQSYIFRFGQQTSVCNFLVYFGAFCRNSLSRISFYAVYHQKLAQAMSTSRGHFKKSGRTLLRPPAQPFCFYRSGFFPALCQHYEGRCCQHETGTRRQIGGIVAGLDRIGGLGVRLAALASTVICAGSLAVIEPLPGVVVPPLLSSGTVPALRVTSLMS